MKYISLIVNDLILDQVPLPKDMTDNQVIDLEEMLRKHKALPKNMELAVTGDIEDFPEVDPNQQSYTYMIAGI